MTEPLYRNDAYLRSCEAMVVESRGRTVVLDRTVFYPMGGGQPGDTGVITWDGGTVDIVDTRNGEGGAILHLAEEGAGLPAPGTKVTASLDWGRRYRHMCMHTAMHLLSTVVTHGVTGGSISAERSRLDFDMQGSTVDKQEVTEQLLALVGQDHAVSTDWITDEELDERPELVKTMSVSPPRGVGRIRLVKIEDLDLQPCGGTHLARTGEVGAVRVSKVENKGKHNRRLHIVLDD